MVEKVRVDHFSDVLCIWAYVSQIRIDELMDNFGDRIEVHYHFFPVFGNVPGRMEKFWKDKGGVTGYSAHVKEVAEKFNHINIHDEVWQGHTPKSSLPAHLHLCAARMAEQDGDLEKGSFNKFLAGIREQFFLNRADVSSQAELQRIASELGLDLGEIEPRITTGAAFAELSNDMQLAVEQEVKSSPTLLLNEGRQRLAGNVGYRIIEANIAELLEGGAGSHAWC